MPIIVGLLVLVAIVIIFQLPGVGIILLFNLPKNDDSIVPISIAFWALLIVSVIIVTAHNKSSKQRKEQDAIDAERRRVQMAKEEVERNRIAALRAREPDVRNALAALDKLPGS
jgi:hypothetical protein